MSRAGQESTAGRGAGDPTLVRVLPAVVGIDKEFDYLVPDRWAAEVEVGTMVRVALGGRRVGGWVVGTGVAPPAGVALRPLAKVRGWGPAPEMVELAGWAAWRWAGRRAHFLRTASPSRAVGGGGASGGGRASAEAPGAAGDASWGALVADAQAGATSILRLPPAADLTPLVTMVAAVGPTLVVVPTAARARVLAERLRRRGARVALMPGDWALARTGCDVVVGTRAAAWAPCAGLAAVVVVDAHDESLTQEAVPTWNAAAVAAERARRAGVPCLLVSPCPTLELRTAGRVLVPSRDVERAGWAPLEAVDRRGDDPRLGLWSERLVRVVREAGRVALVLNRRGRGRLLACSVCAELARCERCGAALAQAEELADEERGVRALACRVCGLRRPPVCARCGSTRLKLLRVGVTRAREELEALVGRPVAEVSGPAGSDAVVSGVAIGTEAILHRAGPLDAVAFVDFDQELLAPRYRAGEDALAMLARASRLVGGRRRHGRVLVQTRLPDHPAVRAAMAADPGIGTADEAELRAALRLPPAVALATLRGEGAAELAATLAGTADGVEMLGPDGDRWLVKGGDHAALCDALAGAGHRGRGPVKIAVDPPRL